MKKILAMVLGMALVLGLLAGCGQPQQAETTEPEITETVPTTTAPIQTEETAPVDGGGTYELALEEEKVTVVLPETYIAYYTEEGAMAAMDASETTDVSYRLLSGCTAEDIHVDILNEVFYATEEGCYQSHTDLAEYNGFTFVSLFYNDDTACHYYWKQVGDGFVLAEIYTEGSELNVDELLNAIEIG